MEIKDLPEGMEQLALFPEELTCSSEEPHVKVSASRESAKDWKEQADLPNTLSDFFGRCVPGGLYGKTCRGRFRAGQMDSSTSTFWSASMQNAGMLVDGVFLTLNMCEWTATLVPFLKEDGVCSLSDILLPTGVIPHRYFLSRTACLGIPRRAASRGKALPEMLRVALEIQANGEKDAHRNPGNPTALVEKIKMEMEEQQQQADRGTKPA